jgi:hypothetical protein
VSLLPESKVVKKTEGEKLKMSFISPQTPPKRLWINCELKL